MPDLDLEFDEAAHLYFRGGVHMPSVTQILEGAGLIDYSFLGARREIYLERGRAVHKATHEDDDQDLGANWSDEVLGYLEGWRAFRRDFGFVPRLIEHRVCNPLHGYAGTLDRVGRIRDGTEIIVDLKSGIAPKAVCYQLAAYAGCLPHPRTLNRRCVELHRDGSYRVMAFKTTDYQRDFETFTWALRALRAMEEPVWA